MGTRTFSEMMAIYFGELHPDEPAWKRHGRYLAIRLKPKEYQEVWYRTEYELTKARVQKLFAEELSKPSLLDKIKKEPGWNGGTLVVPWNT